jgi:hypothetical protein
MASWILPKARLYHTKHDIGSGARDARRLVSGQTPRSEYND